MIRNLIQNGQRLGGLLLLAALAGNVALAQTKDAPKPTRQAERVVETLKSVPKDNNDEKASGEIKTTVEIADPGQTGVRRRAQGEEAEQKPKGDQPLVRKRTATVETPAKQQDIKLQAPEQKTKDIKVPKAEKRLEEVEGLPARGISEPSRVGGELIIKDPKGRLADPAEKPAKGEKYKEGYQYKTGDKKKTEKRTAEELPSRAGSELSGRELILKDGSGQLAKPAEKPAKGEQKEWGKKAAPAATRTERVEEAQESNDLLKKRSEKTIKIEESKAGIRTRRN